MKFNLTAYQIDVDRVLWSSYNTLNIGPCVRFNPCEVD